MKTALITGITGQDGYYLAQFLMKKGYEIHGTSRFDRENKNVFWRLENILDRIKIHRVNLADPKVVKELIIKTQPDEIYHLASDVDPSVRIADEKTIFDTNFLSGHSLLTAIEHGRKGCRLYFAGSSLMFGEVSGKYQNEQSPLNPNTPYGIAKSAVHHFIRMHRKAYGTFACTGFLYNHESPLRSEHFLPRKITKAAALIKMGRQVDLVLGEISTKRDWSYAGDVVESMWLMLQQSEPRDYVIGSGMQHSITDILNIAFEAVDLEWQKYVKYNDSMSRKVEYDNLCADISRARRELRWVPRVGFKQLIEMMVVSDLNQARGGDDSASKINFL